MGVPKAIGSNVPNLMKDVPRVQKCISRWGSAPNHFLMGFKMKSWTIHVQMGIPKTIRSDVPKFERDVPSVPKCVSRRGSAPNNFPMGL